MPFSSGIVLHVVLFKIGHTSCSSDAIESEIDYSPDDE